MCLCFKYFLALSDVLDKWKKMGGIWIHSLDHVVFLDGIQIVLSTNRYKLECIPKEILSAKISPLENENSRKIIIAFIIKSSHNFFKINFRIYTAIFHLFHRLHWQSLRGSSINVNVKFSFYKKSGWLVLGASSCIVYATYIIYYSVSIWQCLSFHCRR